MFFSSSVTDSPNAGLTLRAAVGVISGLALAGGIDGVVGDLRAQSDVKTSIVKIVTTGTRKYDTGRTDYMSELNPYVGSGFIVHTDKPPGGAQTVIVTADHVLGYSEKKTQIPDYTFSARDVPVWVLRSDPACHDSLRSKDEKLGQELCKVTKVFFQNDKGRWEAYEPPITVHREGNRNQDFAVLWVKHFHSDLRRLELGNSAALHDAARRPTGLSPIQLEAWGVDAEKHTEDAFATSLSYPRRDEGPTFRFQSQVRPGNSGGPIIFKDKVIGIVSSIAGGETRGSAIQVVYNGANALSNWNIAAVSRERTPTIENARKAMVTSDYGTAYAMLIDVWDREKKADAARLLAKLNLDKLNNPLAAAEWLKKLSENGDLRAQLELALLPLFVEEEDDSDLRAAREVSTSALGTRKDVGRALSKLARSPATERDALLACIHHAMEDAMPWNRMPDCAPDVLEWLSILTCTIFGPPPCPLPVNQRIKNLKEKRDILAALVGTEEKLESDKQVEDSLFKGAIEGHLRAALLFLRFIAPTSDEARDRFEKVSAVVENAVLRDDNVYVVSEPFFRVLDNQPTRSDLIRGKLLAALSHLAGKSRISESQQLSRAKEVVAAVSEFVRLESIRIDRQVLPYRLLFLVKALVEERDGRVDEAAGSIVRALQDWDDEPSYLPAFIADWNLLNVALRMAVRADSQISRGRLFESIKTSCRDQRCWLPLAARFTEFTSSFGGDGAKLVAERLVSVFLAKRQTTAAPRPEDKRAQGAAALAKLLHDFFLTSKVYDPTSEELNRLLEIQALLTRTSAGPPCAGPQCEPRAWIAAKVDGKDLEDWKLLEGRSADGSQVACKISVNRGLFKTLAGQKRSNSPELYLSATGKDWSKQIIEYDPGYKITSASDPAEKVNLFAIGNREFPATVRSNQQTSYVYVDSTNPMFAKLLDALRAGNVVTVAYRKEGMQAITREHMPLAGFAEAYAAMINQCRSMVSLAGT
jgi:hypothetical protein